GVLLAHWGRRLRGERNRIKDLFFFQAEDGIRDYKVTGVQTCALPILSCLCRSRTASPSGRTRRSRTASGTRTAPVRSTGRWVWPWAPTAPCTSPTTRPAGSGG